MANYRKTSQFWLKKRRLANERKFAKLRPVEKARIVHGYIISALWSLGIWSLFFFVLSVYFWEIVFLIIWMTLFFVGTLLFAYYMKRKLKLRRYQSITYLQKMNPFDFEEYILELCNRLGYSLKETPPSGDDGADGVGRNREGNHMILQTKRYSDSNTVGSPDIRNFIGSMAFYDVRHGLFLTTGYFTKPAFDTISELRSDLRVELIDKDGLLKMIEKAYPRK